MPVDMTTQLPGSRGLPGEKYSNIITIQNTLPKKKNKQTQKTQEVNRSLKTLTWGYVPELNPTEHLCGILQRDETAKVFQQNKSVLVFWYSQNICSEIGAALLSAESDRQTKSMWKYNFFLKFWISNKKFLFWGF